MVTRGLSGRSTMRSRLAIVALAAASLWPATNAHAQLPVPPASLFEMTGFIQNATLDPVDTTKYPNGVDPFRGGTITLNNHKVIVPRNTIFQMPATSLTWVELFAQAPAPWGPTQTGLALSDTPKPTFTFQVTVQGNRVGDAYIAALLFVSPLSLQAHQGFISRIDYANGELIVGGARVRLNDPIGRFGRAMTHDKRFTIDEDNPTVKSETGFPMCIPRTDPNAADDPLCPQGNRPAGKAIFTMGMPAAPTAAERQNPALRTALLDPWRAAPFEIGDYVTVRGPIVNDAAGQYISAYAVDANVGIFTAPGTQPAYVSIDVVLMGTGPLDDVTLAQEGAKRTRVEGFTTDFTAPVMVSAVDVNACTGEAMDRPWNLEAIDPGPPTGAVAGRWRFRPGAPLFDLKGFPFLPPTREVHAVSYSGTVVTMNGLSAGEYTAPNFEFILPENRGIGSPIVPGNFETMAFLTQGSGPRGGAYTGQLSPWPGASAPVRNACAVVGPDQTVSSASTVTLDGSQSVAANVPTGTVSYQWSQISGTSVVSTFKNANTPTLTFTAPTLALGGSNATLTFKLTVTPTNSPAVDSRTVSVIVTPPADSTPPTVGTVTLNPNPPTRLSTLTMTVGNVTDNVGVQGVTFNYTYPTLLSTLPAGCTNTSPTGAPLTKTQCSVKGNKSTTVANTWTASMSFPNTPGTFTFTATAQDAANNTRTSAATTATVR
jgi:K319-like protein